MFAIHQLFIGTVQFAQSCVQTHEGWQFNWSHIANFALRSCAQITTPNLWNNFLFRLQIFLSSTLICTLQILNFFFLYFYFSNLLWYKFHLNCGWKPSKEMILVGRLQTKKPSVKKNLIAFEIHLSGLLLLIRSRCILSQIIRRHQD